ncbi:MAG: hypothetical protein ACTSPB_00050 [Candidatus Thorarchaeota archaeon]
MVRPDGSKGVVDDMINDLIDKGIICEVCWHEECTCVKEESRDGECEYLMVTKRVNGEGVVKIKLSEEEWKLFDELLLQRVSSLLLNLIFTGLNMLFDGDGLKDYRRCKSWFNNMEAYVSTSTDGFPSYEVVDGSVE